MSKTVCTGDLRKCGYENVHAVGNPTEVNIRLFQRTSNKVAETCFTYREAIGMLVYLATGTRTDLVFTVGQLSRFVAEPSTKHVGTLKSALGYLADTLQYGITC